MNSSHKSVAESVTRINQFTIPNMPICLAMFMAASS